MGRFLGFYVTALLLALLCEWALNRYAPSLLPGYTGSAPRDFLKDVGSYLIAAQIGILTIVTVAVGVVTLLSDRQDGSSANTDIRLYYVESYSYELAASGIALLVVLTLQLFWPLQHILSNRGSSQMLRGVLHYAEIGEFVRIVEREATPILRGRPH
jgi:hypothetical protein